MVGSWPETEARLYAIFVRDFKVGRPRFRGLPVWWDQRILPGERYEEGFWHLVTETDRPSGDRIPDFRRAERLPWCRAAIDHASEPEVTAFDYLEGSGDLRTYLWMQPFDYVTILKRKKQRDGSDKAYFLVTAFHVGGTSTRRGLGGKLRKAV